MAKDLKAKVSIDAKSSVKDLDKLIRKINQINNAVNKTANGRSGLNEQLRKATTTANRLDKTIKNVAHSQNKVTKAVKETNKAAGQTGNIFSGLLGKVGGIASALFGIMGARAAAQTADAITGAENKLNYMNGGDTAATQAQMDKMYAIAQESRMAYTDMMSNVGKSMTLASDAFGGNIDNAIKFQEIMAKSYTLAGASDAEMSSSMYQLIQGLGSGILQGDELRSVREGAPLAYKAIEEFAQGIYGAEENLKDLASQGKITSDIVVAAMLNAGEGIETAFEDTQMTFGQAWQKIKNSATKAFEPVLQRATQMLNDFADSGGFAKIESTLNGLAAVANGALTAINGVATFVANNWSWLGDVLGIVFLTLIGLLIVYVATVVWGALVSAAAWVVANWQLVLICLTIAVLIWLIFQVANGTIQATDAMALAFIILAVLIAILVGGTVGLIIAGVLLLAAFIIAKLDWVMGAIYVMGAFFKNVFYSILNIAIGIGHALAAVWDNIKIAFVNSFLECKAEFWDFVEMVSSGVLKVANLINKVLGIFGIEINTSALEDAVNTARSNAERNRSKKLERTDVAAAYANGASTYDTWQTGWVQDAYSNGSAVGTKWSDSINSAIGGLFSGNKLGDKLNLSNLGLNTTSTFDPAALGDIAGNTGKTAGNTDKLADSMKLAEEDLAYLKEVAHMEWKKEFTTATIKVDMSNYNTINGDNDLDGIVTKLTDKLYEELDSMANGVYAY